MAKIDLKEHMRERGPATNAVKIGPFVTISRQYGCWGFSLGLLLQEILNERCGPEVSWRILNKEILDRLARETNLAGEVLEEQRRCKPSLLVDFFRSFSEVRIPSGYEVRNRITTIIRGEAAKGHAVIIGQGGAGATSDLPNGLSVRLEAPEQWRVEQVAFRNHVSRDEALEQIVRMEEQREYLRHIYDLRFQRKPAFHLVFDCSEFRLAHIAQLITQAMTVRGLLDA